MLLIAFFLLFLALFLVIGLSASLKARHTTRDYYLASQQAPPWMVGLSALATNNSGYMFIGVVGYTFVVGLPAFWLMVGWIGGDLLASCFVHKRLRQVTEESGESSYITVLRYWGSIRQHHWQHFAAVISLVFLLAYASAQLVAASKALTVLLSWPGWVGAVLSAAMVIAYCYAGGIRASMWTDIVQSIVMVLAIGILLMVTVSATGGITSAVTAMGDIDGFLNWFPETLALPGASGALLFVVGWFLAGFSTVGQPHVMVRFMTLKNSDKMLQARIWYYLFYTLFYIMVTCVAMLSRVYLGTPEGFDAELALPTMAKQLLPLWLTGVILAGIFAATLSTADSLILSCSAAITHDLLPVNMEKEKLLRATTVGVALIALFWSLSGENSVFALVILAWSGLGAVFTPLLLIYILGGKLDDKIAIAISASALVTALIWRWLGWHDFIYEGLPGTLVGLTAYGIYHARKRQTKVI